jgi:hypothetical protein
MITLWQNEASPNGAVNTVRALDHLLDATERRSVMDATKYCPRCVRNLPQDAFYPSMWARDRKSGHCKVCSVAWQKERYRAIRGIPLDDSDLRLRRKDEHPRWCEANVSYGTLHTRLSAVRGSASRRECTHCAAPAADWAYDHTDPNELRDERGTYSTDLARYFPLCKSCHKRYDNEHARRT